MLYSCFAYLRYLKRPRVSTEHFWACEPSGCCASYKCYRIACGRRRLYSEWISTLWLFLALVRAHIDSEVFAASKVDKFDLQ